MKPSSPDRLRWVVATLLVTGAVAANAAFAGLGASFDYPDVLQRPPVEILRMFHDTRATTTRWFAVLAAGAALLAPAAVLLARRWPSRAATWSARVGVAASIVQVVGLSRWFVLVPRYADVALDPAASTASRAEAIHGFERAHDLLGTIVGETFGYLLTAAWTVLVVRSVPATRTWFTAWGAACAVLIASGVVVPLGVPGADLANFIGYVLWSGWIVALAVVVVRG